MSSGDNGPLPAVEALQIHGQAVPGQEIQACGYTINGTTSCQFAWLRISEDGSTNYITGANQPNYKVTQDDVNRYLAFEVVPIDSRGRQGEVTRTFANNGKMISND
ncbi:hypothetical protein K2173_008309 [Erythroxylum novogranatense]|uniref:AIR9-like A9 domain-containing protein n=1 Tax=Erythroxylum novogranatense TaxID=1862640 RepID=A0AAV8U3I5_9ROSI|nr:hypothetical protein K2173_008309 [Erythroxylum novogranatense]